MFAASAGDHIYGLRLTPPERATRFDFGDGPERVDVILRPDPGVAEQTAELSEFWGGGVTFQGVPVLRERDPDDG